MEESKKRKAPQTDDANKRSKKQWRVPRKTWDASQTRTIQPGDSGIWATCDKGRESKAIGELRDLFNEYAELLYADELAAEEEGAEDDAEELSIEDSIKAEVQGIKKPTREPLFTNVRVDVQCVLFFKTRAPIDPVTFVRRICLDALASSERKRTRFVKRLCPMTLMGKATAEGLEKTAGEVLRPHFQREPFVSRKFAIRPSLRNHNTLTRNTIIQQVATLVGPGHSVDLKGYDDLIIVEAYTNVCGVSVVPNDFEELKRYNLSEIFSPTPKEQPKEERTVEEAKATEAS